MSKKMPVLIINSYAGSLVVAARQEGHPIVGSYEDSGYGLEIQRHNEPKLDYRDTVAGWPVKQDLRDTLVIAHPPCAAFSQQVSSAGCHCRGLDATKFQQTRTVLDYALRNRAAALAIESVPGALEGARQVHDEVANKYGYTVHRVLQDAASFVPQKRARAWFVFLPKGHTLQLPPLPSRDVTPHAIKHILAPENQGGPVYPWVLRGMEKQWEKLREFSPTVRRALISGSFGTGLLAAVIRRYLMTRGKTAAELGSVRDVAEKYVDKWQFMSNTPRLLDPDGQASTLTCTTWWLCEGRPLTALEYQRVMGFPDTYDLVGPGGLSKHPGYLSRGVCPPVARWILQGLQATVEGTAKRSWHRGLAGETLDLRPGRLIT
jgi:site-specific DNA-cytosine methylase